MADDGLQLMQSDHEKRFLRDPYLDRVEAEGPPVHEGFGLDLLALETGTWPRFDVKKGGCQIEYTDQDPRLHRQRLDAIAKTGVRSDMSDTIDESQFRK